MNRLYKHEDSGNYILVRNGKSIMLLDNGVGFERVPLDYKFISDEMEEVKDVFEKREILERIGL